MDCLVNRNAPDRIGWGRFFIVVWEVYKTRRKDSRGSGVLVWGDVFTCYDYTNILDYNLANCQKNKGLELFA